MDLSAFSPAIVGARGITRRHFFQATGLGIGAMALEALLARDGVAAPSANPLAPKTPMFAPTAKRVIYLHMAGSPSQLEMFEHKPELVKLHMQDCPPSFLEGKRFAFIKGVPKILAGQFAFQRHGQSGQWISKLLPHFAKVVDKTCVIRTVQTEQFNHAPAQLLVQTGSPRLGNPSLGSWVTYGLGSLNENLPGFVVLLSGGKTPDGGKSLWGSGFLPGVYQGVQCRTSGDPVLYLGDPAGLDRLLRRRMLDTLAQMNNAEYRRSGDGETLTRIAQYELAYRMQMSVPEALDIAQEPRHILDLYGAQPGFVSAAENSKDPSILYQGDDPTFANNCLLARRLIENGVRFVQLYDYGWDHHGSSPGESIDETLPIKCQQTDRAIAGLLIDLEQRGLLKETLVVWGGEFGRTPMMQNNVRTELKKGFIGRDVLTTPVRTVLPDAVMLPQFFRQQGYYSAGAGKIFHSVRTSDPASWDRYEDRAGDNEQEQAAIHARYGGGDGRPRWHVLDGEGEDTRDGLNARTIRRLIGERSDAGTPFFLAAGFHKPHLPWTAPRRFFELYVESGIQIPAEPAMRDIPPIALQTELSGFAQPESRAGAWRGYFACVSFIDHQIGLLLDELDRRDLWSNTLVVLLGDHGFHLGDHGGLWAKLSAFDAATRVPLLFAGAGVPAGRVVSTPVELVDVYPTLVDLAGFSVPAELEGRSLRPLLDGKTLAAARAAYSLVHHYDVAAKRDVTGHTVIGAQWRYTQWDGGAAGREFYWRPDDPGEYHNRVADAALEASRTNAETLLGATPKPKPAPATRPRALEARETAALSANQVVKPGRPNFVVILLDDLGWTDFGCMGSTFYETPNIDRLATQGMKFSQAYAAASLCSPTRASLLTGKYPARLHITDFIPGRPRPHAKLIMPNWTKHLPLEEWTLAEALREAGYATASIGKWHLGDAEFFPDQQGFDRAIACTESGAAPSYFSPYRIATLPDGEAGEYLTDRESLEAVRFIEANQDRPFFLYLPHHAVHTPIQAKQELIEKYRRKATPGAPHSHATYAAMIESADQGVGRVLAKLDELRLAERTVVVVTSDNGGLLAMTKNTPLRAGKGSVYEGGVRVPLLIRAPGIVSPRTACDVPVITCDLYPTILALAGVRPKPNQTVAGQTRPVASRGRRSNAHAQSQP